MLRLNLIGYNIYMKTFIFLFILLISFFAYLFVFSQKQREQKLDFNETDDSPSLRAIEKKIEKKFDSTDQNNKSEEYTFSKKLKQSVIYDKEMQKPISENVTFDTLIEIISQIKPDYPKNSITLNTDMNSLLTTKEDKKRFEEKIQENFNLKEPRIKELMKKNRLLWDWVNTLRK